MSKLKAMFRKDYDDSGSTLVAVVVFGLVLMIAGTGYLHVMSNTVSHEITALDDEKAYQTAESGLLLGLKWARDPENWAVRPAVGGSATLIDEEDFLNGMDLLVTIYTVPETSGDEYGFDTTKVEASVKGGSLTYRKVLTAAVIDNSSDVGTFINNFGPFGKVGGGGLSNVTFDGPVHSNTPIYLSSVSNPTAAGAGVRFLGNVTVFNGDPDNLELPPIRENFDFTNNIKGYMGNYGESDVTENSYTFGIWKHGEKQGDPLEEVDYPTAASSSLDKHFIEGTGTFKHSQEYLSMDPITQFDQKLPTSLDGEELPFVRYLPDGAEYYHHYLNDDNEIVFGINPKLPATYSYANKVLWAEHDIGVLGKVRGKTTLATLGNHNICPLGELTYEGFTALDNYYYENNDTAGNYGVGGDFDNFIALVSQGDIFFDQTNKKFNSSVPGKLEDDPQEYLYITASLIAVEEGKGVWWKTKKDERFGQIEGYGDYKLRAIGDRILDTWFGYDAGGTNSNELFGFYYDSRLSRNLRAPGVPLITGADGPVEGFEQEYLWSEENIPLD